MIGRVGAETQPAGDDHKMLADGALDGPGIPQGTRARRSAAPSERAQTAVDTAPTERMVWTSVSESAGSPEMLIAISPTAVGHRAW